ncbi:GNAT family N-acetyltransferase [Brasilonema sp. UFV-L1]|nr:GNAT family N-acetyltransferase [Brasilonema sp. UFV-L1]NMG05552.1 N-acetyltransferase [Brasilonema sp. UFV-L1]
MMKLIAPETTLETSRLLLEPLMASHAIHMYRQLQDERLYQFIPQEPPISLQVLQTRYRALSSRLSPDGQEAWLNWAFRLRAGTYIGTLEATVYANQRAAIAYMIFPPFWQQGYAKEGCLRLLNHVFNDYQVNIVAAEIDTRNVASIKLIKSLGFKHVSTKENADFFKGCVSHEYRYECMSSPSSLTHLPVR